MDEMKIVSKFTRNMISKILKVMLKKKSGYNVDIQINDVNVTINEGKTHVHLDVDAELDKDELMKLIKNFGLN
jgi:2-hydroxy-3-keto-5-methylthiopentenyl-1-phosphate phosphatase